MRIILHFRYLLLLFLLCATNSLLAGIDGSRKFQLDSITTNIDKAIRKDLQKVHTYLHAQGRNNEERVWMFYGFISTHFKYDNDRKKQKDAAYYTAGYTTKKMSGVCDDFAHLFKDLCDRSNIPCLVVFGKAKMGVWDIPDIFRNVFRRQSNKINHAWNIVKPEQQWQLMDPTWGGILRTEKLQRYDVRLKKNVAVSVKIVDRKFYAPDPEFMKKDHKPVHPAFYASPVVATFKTAFRRAPRRKIYRENYKYAPQLDSIYAAPYPLFSNAFQDEAKSYSSLKLIRYFFSRELTFPSQKTAAPLTVEDYVSNLEHVKQLSAYILKNHHISTEMQVRDYESIINQKIRKIRRMQENEQKSKGRITKK